MRTHVIPTFNRKGAKTMKWKTLSGTGLAAALVLLLSSCSWMNPKVSDDERDPINEARAAVEVSTGGTEDIIDPITNQRIGEKSVRGIDGTYWSQEVASGNMDSTQKIKNDTPLEELATGMAAIGARDTLTPNHVAIVQEMSKFGIAVSDRANYDSHEFTITAMQDAEWAGRTSIAKYNNQRVAIDNANKTTEAALSYVHSLGAGAITGGGSYGIKAVQGVISLVADKVGLSQAEVASIIDDNPELSGQLATLSGSPGFVDGTLTVDQLFKAMDEVERLVERALSMRDKINNATNVGNDDTPSSPTISQ